MTDEFNEVADLTPAYRSGIDAWDGRLSPPRPERGVATQPPANAANLSGIGADPNGRGPASKPPISPLSAASPNTADAMPASTVVQAVHMSGIVNEPRTAPMQSRDNNIVVFYEHRKTKVIHIRIQAAGDKLQVIDRPATPPDRFRYPRQWNHFENSEDQIKHNGTPLAKLFSQQPTLVAQLTAE